MHIPPLLVLFVQCVYGVKEHMFKNCDNSGFCHRNRHFAQQVASNPSYSPSYSIDGDSISIHNDLSSEWLISANIKKELPSELDLGNIILPLKISFLPKNSIRFQIDEEQRQSITPGNKYVNSQRYNGTSDWAFQHTATTNTWENVNLDIESLKNKISASYGPAQEYLVEIQFNPIKFTISRHGEVQLIANEQNFLNIEHWRPQAENARHLTPEESDFNMFHDDFQDSSSDTIPLGPESVALDFTFKHFKNVYGIPEHADSFNLKDTTQTKYPYRLYNVDIFEYETNSRLPMYGSIPFMLALKPECSVGLFWINSADTFIDVDKTSKGGCCTRTHWISENNVLDFMLIIGESPNDINESYGAIVGYSQLPQVASLGYHQCRWNYNDEKDVLEINSLFDKHRIPYDYIWLDIEYAESKKYFTWNQDTFPDPERMVKELDHTGRNLVIIVDPHLKTGYFGSDELIKRKITINSPSNNQTYKGHCWPGESVWIDTMNPSSQAYWDYMFRYTDDNKFMGGLTTNVQIWNDMNEPSIFNGPETTSPRDLLHYGSWEHRSIHNVYGLTYHEATYKSMTERFTETGNKRPFILTRSYFAGSQRTAAIWSGDNMSTWEHLKISIPMLLTSGVLGLPFAGADVGGFFGNPSKELLTRWYQTGIWYPFFRGHAHIDSRRREPWVPGEPYTSIIRDALQLRYSLLPVIYTAFHESSTTGLPVIKPIFYENRKDIENFSIEDEFFLGNSGIFVKPVTDEAAETIDIYLPDEEIYYEFDNGVLSGNSVHRQLDKKSVTKHVDINTIPMYLKGGSIIAKKERYRRSSKLMVNDPYHLIIALDKSGKSSGKLYIDDGESFDYLQGESILIEFSATEENITASTTSQGQKFQNLILGVRIEQITIIGQDNSILPKKFLITQGGKKWQFRGVTQEKSTTIKNPGLRVDEDWTIEPLVDNQVHDEL